MGGGGGLYPGGLIKGCLFLCVPGKWASNDETVGEFQ